MSDYSTYSDEQLLVLLKESDEDAFREIYNRYWKKLLIKASHKIGSLQLAEEAIQDIFFSLWNRRQSLEIAGQLHVYLISATTLQIIKHRHNIQKHRLKYNNFAQDSSSETGSEEFVNFERVERRITQLVASLPEQTRIIYILHKEDGNTYKEIAAALHISPKTVDYHISKAVKTLRAAVAGLITLVFIFF